MRPDTILLAAVAVMAVAAGPARADVKAGIDAWQRGDYAAAVGEWRGLAAKGDADAQFNLGQAYKLGRGVPVDLKQAQAWYLKAASQGHDQAQANLGLILFQGGDRAAAMPWIVKAADHGDARSQYVYGTALFNGDNVPKDWPRAYAMMTKAAAAGLPQAATSLSQMDNYIPAAQREQGVAMAGTAVAPPPVVTTSAVSPRTQLAVAATKAPVAPPAAKRVPAVSSAPASTGSAWRVQLGAYGTQAGAAKAWAAVKGKVSGLAALSPDYAAAGALTRLRAGPVAGKAAAQKLCAAATAAKQPCLPVAP